MKLWQRALLVVISLPAAYALWRFPLGGIGTLVIGVLAAWLGRSVYRSKLATNPAGENRDYSLRPGVIAAAKSIALFAVALVWALLGGYAYRWKFIPDTLLSALVVFVPAVLLLVTSGLYMFAAMMKMMFGGEPKQGGVQ